jgi:Uma2 family endonuclease
MATTVRRLTWDDLVLIREERAGDRQELIDGKLVVTPACTPPHQITLGDVTRPLMDFVEQNDRGSVFPVPAGVRFSPENVLIPDALFVARHRLHVIGPEAIDAAPDLIVEVLAPETRQRDLTTKRALYARFGVQEYWIINPEERMIDVLVLAGDSYESIPADEGGAIRSRVLPGLVLTPGIAFEGIEKLWGSHWPA